MKKDLLAVFAALLISMPAFAQIPTFRTKSRMDNLEGFDMKKFSWGFYLVGNYFDYKLVLHPKYGMDGYQNAVQSDGSPGFGAGLIGKMRLHENVDVRLEPALHFVQRKFSFNTQGNSKYYMGNSGEVLFLPQTLTRADMERTVKSTYIDLPLLVEVHGDRWYNSRAYAAGGINYLINLQSAQKSQEDNQQGVFRTTTHNFAWSVEAGLQFYFKRFKLTPGFRGTFFLNNELVKDNPDTPPYWAGAISTAKTHAFMFVLKFE